MALILPQTMISTRAMSQTFELERVDYLSPEAGGRLGAITAGFPRWLTTLTYNNMDFATAARLRAWLDIQRGAQRTFVAYDVDRQVPFWHQGGGRPYNATAAEWSQDIDGDGIARLSLGGLMTGQVVSVGDYVGQVWGASKLALVRACETVVADGSGDATFAIEPPVPTLVPGDAAINLKRASCLMRLDTANTKLAEQGLGYFGSGSKLSAGQDLVA